MSAIESTTSLVALLALILGYILGRITEKAKWIDRFILMDEFKQFVKVKRKSKNDDRLAE